jgi:hypothetical protein
MYYVAYQALYKNMPWAVVRYVQTPEGKISIEQEAGFAKLADAEQACADLNAELTRAKPAPWRLVLPSLVGALILHLPDPMAFYKEVDQFLTTAAHGTPLIEYARATLATATVTMITRRGERVYSKKDAVMILEFPNERGDYQFSFGSHPGVNYSLPITLIQLRDYLPREHYRVICPDPTCSEYLEKFNEAYPDE